MADDPKSDSNVAHIVADLMTKIEPLLSEALDRAFVSGTEYASSLFKERMEVIRPQLDTLLKMTREVTEIVERQKKANTAVSEIQQPPEEGRAALGTVKPKVLELVSRPNGASVQELEAIGIKPNSIRGTLYSLQKDKKIEKRGGRWFRLASDMFEAPTSEPEGAS
jgi:hypothetical protein